MARSVQKERIPRAVQDVANPNLAGILGLNGILAACSEFVQSGHLLSAALDFPKILALWIDWVKFPQPQIFAEFLSIGDETSVQSSEILKLFQVVDDHIFQYRDETGYFGTKNAYKKPIIRPFGRGFDERLVEIRPIVPQRELGHLLSDEPIVPPPSGDFAT